jgi:hypothetical protein
VHSQTFTWRSEDWDDSIQAAENPSARLLQHVSSRSSLVHVSNCWLNFVAAIGPGEDLRARLPRLNRFLEHYLHLIAARIAG